MDFFEEIFGQPFGGMFDMDGDGKTDFTEEWLGYMVMNEVMKEESSDKDDTDSDDLSDLL